MSDKKEKVDYHIFTPLFILKVGIVAVLFCGLGYWLILWTMDAFIHSSREVTVPNVTNKSSSYALETLSKNKLAMRVVDYEYNESVPIETILRQTPSAGITVREGKVVRVVFSKGGENVFTPNLTGLQLRNAELKLRKALLTLGEVNEAYSLVVEKGAVISQDPASEANVPKNTMINLKVSAGVPPAGIVMMENFLNKQKEDVQQWAQKNGLDVTFTEDGNSIYPSGTVLEQEPAADTVIGKGIKVSFIISSHKDSGSNDGNYHIYYEVPQGGVQKHIRIVIVGRKGENEQYNNYPSPGQKISLIVPKEDGLKMRVYSNDILVQETPIK